MTAAKPVEGDALLTEAFKALNGRDKWETLVLSGLIGTDEPWIPAMTETLRREAAALASLERRVRGLEGAIDDAILDLDYIAREVPVNYIATNLRAALQG